MYIYIKMCMEHKGISLLDLGPISQNLNIHMQICQNLTQILPPPPTPRYFWSKHLR